MYEQHFGFSKKPFSISPDPAFLYLNDNYREAIALLRYAIKEQQGIVSLIGEVGTGKTMLLNVLLDTLPAGACVVRIPPIRFEFDDLVSFVLDKLRTPDTSPRGKHSFDDLFDILHGMVVAGERVILLVDEAQDLDDDSLESVRLLSNFETPSKKLLQILLVGQPELRRKLNRPELRQLKQRIAVSYELSPLSTQEVLSYIAHRLKAAGYSNGTSLFTPDASQLIASSSKGIPRLVNALCDNALVSGFAANKHWIDAGMVREAVNDLMLNSPADPSEMQREGGATAATAISAAEAPPVPTDSRVRPSPLRLVAVIMILALMLGGLFAQTLLQALPVDWRQHLAGLVDPAINQPSADVSSPDGPSGDRPESAPASAVDQRLTEPTTTPEGPAAETRSQAMPPDREARPPQADTSRSETALGRANLVMGSGAVQEGRSMPANGMPAIDMPATGTPDAAAPFAAATTPRGWESRPPVQPRSRDDVSSQRGDLGGPSSRQPERLLPVKVDTPDQETISAARATARADTRPTVAPENVVPANVAPENVVPVNVASATVNETRDSSPSANAVIDPVEQPGFIRVTLPERGLAEPTQIQTPPPTAEVTIRQGDTITEIARRVYGEVGIFELAAIRIANPEIRNLDVVDLGRQVVIPDLSPGLLLSTESDGSARALLGATRSLASAQAMQAIFERNGVRTDIVADRLSNTITAYRLETRFSPEGPPTAEALDQLSTLRLQLADYGD